MTVRELLTRSLRSLGVLASGEPLPASDGADALVILSDLLDRWQTERLTVFSEGRTAFPLVNATQRYTLGAGGTWNGPRPVWIDRATRLTADGLEIPIRLFTRTEWQQLSIKALVSSLPEGVYVNPTFPLAAVDVWPVPADATVQIVLYAPQAALTAVTSLDTALVLPPGWSAALRYALALALAPEYGVTVSPELSALASTTKADIKRTNQLPDEMTLDPFWTRQRHGASVSKADFLSGNL